jgi:hypothetical protein
MTTSTETRNSAGHTFKEWFRLADQFVAAACGYGLDDLFDVWQWDAWNDDESPEDYASSMLYDGGFPC